MDQFAGPCLASFLVMKGTRTLELAPKYKVPSRVSFFIRFCLFRFLGFSFSV